MRARHVAAAIAASMVVACAAYAAQDAVSQKGKAFIPDELTQPVGSTLLIENNDTVTHNIQVTAPDGTTSNLGLQKPGDSIELPLASAGEYLVHCGIHPKMKLAVHAR